MYIYIYSFIIILPTNNAYTQWKLDRNYALLYYFIKLILLMKMAIEVCFLKAVANIKQGFVILSDGKSGPI